MEGIAKVKIISQADFVKLEFFVNQFLQTEKLTTARIKSIQYSAYPPALVSGEPCQALIMYF